MGLPLYFICFFSFTAINILSLFCVLVILMIICHGEVLLLSYLFGVLEASYTWMTKTFLRFGKFSVILLNILHISLACTSSSSMAMILGFGFLMELLSSCVFFHSSWVVWLRFLLAFSLISSLSSGSEICLLLVLICYSGLPLCCFVWLKGLFISRISVWFFLLRFSISLFNFSFIFCVVFFNSYLFL
jgi:hypothetical protein